VYRDRYPVLWAGRRAVIVLPEHIDQANASQVSEELLSVINRGAAALIVDMTATASCDYTGANALLRARLRAVASGTVLRIAVTDLIIRRTLSLSGIDHLISIYPSLDAALAAAEQPAATASAPGRPPRLSAVRIDRLDHLVLTVASIDATVDFYTRVLGMKAVKFGAGRTALTFGRTKINLHQSGHEFEPRADRPTPGSADLCLITTDPLDQVIGELGAHGVPVEEGPVDRAGATGAILSVYFRDPDKNLIEVSTYR
jgi:anti-anti-sigma factor